MDRKLKQVVVVQSGIEFFPNPEFIKKIPLRYRRTWAKRLLSGKYEQGRKALCIKDLCGNKTWCCLGVASHRLDNIWLDQPLPLRGSNFHKRFKSTDPHLAVNYSRPYEASHLNDQVKLSFEQLAMLIWPENWS